MQLPGNTARKEDDQLVIRAIREKDKRAFEILYKKHYRHLHALASRYIDRDEIAEEVVHDVFLNIWNNPGELVIQHSLGSYLSRAVVNSSLNFLKKEQRQDHRLEEYSRWQAGSGEDQEDEKEQLLLRLEIALDQLPPQCKKVMLLSRFDKMKQQEIAGMLNISVKTVKNHLTYGFNKMRNILHDKEIIAAFLLIKMINWL